MENIENIQETNVDRTTEGGKRCCWGILTWDDSYIRREWGGRLKLLELTTTTISAALLPVTVEYYLSAFILFRFVAFTSLIFVCVDLFLHITRLYERLWTWIRTPGVSMVLTAIAVFSWLLCSSLIVSVADSTSNRSSTTIACISGYLSAAFFLVETVLHCMRSRNI